MIYLEENKVYTSIHDVSHRMYYFCYKVHNINTVIPKFLPNNEIHLLYSIPELMKCDFKAILYDTYISYRFFDDENINQEDTGFRSLYDFMKISYIPEINASRTIFYPFIKQYKTIEDKDGSVSYKEDPDNVTVFIDKDKLIIDNKNLSKKELGFLLNKLSKMGFNESTVGNK